jgi:hypothetical protein
MAENNPRGTPIMEWTFPEFAQYERGRGWFISFFVVLLVSVGLALLGKVYTAIPVIILIALILILRFRRRPTEIPVRITDLNLEVGDSVVRWDELKEFWIVYRPPEIKKLYVTFKTTVRQPYSIDIMAQNPLKIREALSEFLPENVALESETASDQLLRFFKL